MLHWNETNWIALYNIFYCVGEFIFPLYLSNALNSFFCCCFKILFKNITHEHCIYIIPELSTSHVFPISLPNSYPIISPINIQVTVTISICSLDMCPCLTTWKWLIYAGVLLWRTLILSQYPLTTYSSSFSFPFTNSPSMPACQLVASLFRSCSGNHIVEILWLQIFCHV